MKVTVQLPIKSRAERLPPIAISEAEFGPWVLLKSSNLRACRYRESDMTLDVAFHSSSLYRYSHVTKGQFTTLINAPSAGQCFHQTIKNLHISTKLAG